MIVADMLDLAARQFGDPRKTRINLADWLQIYNDAMEKITVDWQVLEEDATFTIVADESRYMYPEAAVQLRRVFFSETPSDDTTWRELADTPWDLFRNLTNCSLPENAPTRYCPRAQFFEMTPRPTAGIDDGGKVSYWKLADVIANEDDNFELQGLHRMTVRDLMVILAKERMGRAEESTRELAIWTERLERIAKKIEHRSDDRRPALRLRSRTRLGGMFT